MKNLIKKILYKGCILDDYLVDEVKQKLDTINMIAGEDYFMYLDTDNQVVIIIVNEKALFRPILARTINYDN